MYFMGVDIGGSKTDVVIADESGKVVSYLRTKGANYQGVGVDQAFEIINQAVNQAMTKAGLKKIDLTYSYFGVAGADMDFEIKITKSILDKLNLEKYSFDNDGRIALRSGTLDDVGILISCGTGGINYACDKKTISRKGGFSRFFGERLGSFIIAGMVASAIIRSKDKRDEHTLMQQIFETKIGKPIEDIMHYEYMGHDRSKIYEYAILLIQTLYEAAHLFDYVALKILSQIVDEVVKIVDAFTREMHFTFPVKVVLEGGFFKNADEILIKMIKSALGSEFNVIIPKHPPVVGAVLLAAEISGHPFDENAIARLIKYWSDEQ
ncbi:N-acetylglucosamine kinase [Thermotoga profunda]|uniref:N-acetylglucosamine kinase n=1 Tax=Thermotoga profunda TaxID=1508420 RepID=UPI00059796BB|nr:BadF/BadG/BcrA/BcrD ATPase family protein [Thermotoga profunda]